MQTSLSPLTTLPTNFGSTTSETFTRILGHRLLTTNFYREHSAYVFAWPTCTSTLPRHCVRIPRNLNYSSHANHFSQSALWIHKSASALDRMGLDGDNGNWADRRQQWLACRAICLGHCTISACIIGVGCLMDLDTAASWRIVFSIAGWLANGFGSRPCWVTDCLDGSKWSWAHISCNNRYPYCSS